MTERPTTNHDETAEDELRVALDDVDCEIMMQRKTWTNGYEEHYKDLKTERKWVRVFPFSHTERK